MGHAQAPYEKALTIALSGGREHPNRTAKPTSPRSAMNCGRPLKRAVIRLR
jgi:hypothetical protein